MKYFNVDTAGSQRMADKVLFNAYKGRAKSVNLSNKNLTQVPGIIGQISTLKAVDLKNNKIFSLPSEFASLNQVR